MDQSGTPTTGHRPVDGQIIKYGELDGEQDEGQTLTLTFHLPPGTKRRHVIEAATEQIKELMQVSGRAALTLAEARDIAYYFGQGGFFSATYLAKSYGISVKAVREIVSGEDPRWPWLGSGAWWESPDDAIRWKK